MLRTCVSLILRKIAIDQFGSFWGSVVVPDPWLDEAELMTMVAAVVPD